MDELEKTAALNEVAMRFVYSLQTKYEDLWRTYDLSWYGTIKPDEYGERRIGVCVGGHVQANIVAWFVMPAGTERVRVERAKS